MLHPITTLNSPTIKNSQLIGASPSTISIVVVDAEVTLSHYLLANPIEDAEVHNLNGQEDGIAQILSLLKQYQNLSKLILFCKGASNRIDLGTTFLNEANLWIYADTIREWRNFFTHDAEILIHGCDLATTQTGQALVSWLAFLTRACVRVV